MLIALGKRGEYCVFFNKITLDQRIILIMLGLEGLSSLTVLKALKALEEMPREGRC